MKEPTFLVTAPFRGEGLDLLESLGRVIYDPWIDYEPLRVYDGEKLAKRLRKEDANVAVCEADFCFDPLFEVPLLAIGSTRGDPTNVDVAAATRHGVPVLNAPGRNADGVAEMTVAMLMGVTRHLLPADRDLRKGLVFKNDTIPYQRYRAWQVAEQTAGLVGLGAVGRATKWRLEGLGMNVIAYDPYNPEAKHSFEDVLEQADVVSVHAAVTDGTTAMMGRDQFAAMKDGAVYLNSARAGLHDLGALTEALLSGKLSAAALDHFDGEQLPADHPILELDNVLLTPHIGGATYETEANHSTMIASDLAALLSRKRPRHIVNPEVLDQHREQ